MAGLISTNQRDFRGINDDGNESSASFIASLNSDWTQAQDVNFRLRYAIEKTAGTTWNSTNTVKFQYNKNGAGWSDITSSSSVVRLATSSYVSDEAATTQRISSPDSFAAGNVMTATTLSTTTVGNSGATCEYEICAKVRSTDTSVGDNIQIRVVNLSGTATTTTAHTVTLTVSAAVASFSPLTSSTLLTF